MKRYSIVGITEQEFVTKGMSTADAIRHAVAKASEVSAAKAHWESAMGYRVAKADMHLVVCDPIPAGEPPLAGIDQCRAAVFLNDIAVQACEDAGLRLNIVADTEELPPSVPLVNLPLYFAVNF